MAAPPPPPPRRTTPSTSTPTTTTPEETTWKTRMKAKSSVWGKKAVEKGFILSDNIGHRVNDIAEKRFGTEHFWPVTGDFVKEMDKCARIIRSFTVEGVVKEETVEEGKTKKKQKVLRKIPPEVIREAKGIAVFTCMRSGFAPLGGSGGAGMVIAKLPDGSWSPPSSISPNNLSGGLLIGLDVYDCILVIRSQKALDSFGSHKVTLGAEIGVAAGPFGAGAAVETGKEKAPVFSYVNSKGLYAGVEVVGQVFVERYDENGAMYHWPGVKAADILAGKVKVPVEAANLHAALRDAETGKAQAEKGNYLDTVLNPSNPDSNNRSPIDIGLSEGEVLRLPPTPDQTDGTEMQSDPETEKVSHSDHQTVPLPSGSIGGTLAPPPLHPQSSRKGSPAPILPPRPGMGHQYSSQSNYSTNEEFDDPTLPPTYQPGSGRDDYAEKKLDTRDTTGMTEGEKREWEEHWREEDDEALRRALRNSTLGNDAPAHGSEPAVNPGEGLR